jgi:hypothetical protein
VNFSPFGKSLEERLANIGEAVLQEVLTPEWIGLLRLLPQTKSALSGPERAEKLH